MLYVAGHGERVGDAVRAGVWREEVPHAGRVPAALVGRPPPLRRRADADLHLHGESAAADRAVPGAVAPRRPDEHLVAPSALRHGDALAAHPIPAEPAQELGDRNHCWRRARHARRDHVPPRARVPPRLRRGCRRRRPVVVVRRARSVLLRRRWRVSAVLEGFLHGGVRGLLGIHQTLIGVRSHALVRPISFQVRSDHRAQQHLLFQTHAIDLLAYSLENWYYRVLVLLTGYLKNAEIAVDALSIW
jgi:hypothetical protein